RTMAPAIAKYPDTPPAERSRTRSPSGETMRAGRRPPGSGAGAGDGEAECRPRAGMCGIGELGPETPPCVGGAPVCACAPPGGRWATGDSGEPEEPAWEPCDP